MYPFNLMNTSLLLSGGGVEVGVHYYWDIAGISLHGQVFIVMWFVIILLLGAAILGTAKLDRIPEGWQNFMESVIDLHQILRKTNLVKAFTALGFPL